MELNWVKINKEKTNLPKVGKEVLIFVEADENSPDGYWNDIRLDKLERKNEKLYWENLFTLGYFSVTHYAYIEPPVTRKK